MSHDGSATTSPVSFEPHGSAWGLSLQDARLQIEPGSNAFGLVVVGCDLRATAARKPVLDVVYELAEPPDYVPALDSWLPTLTSRWGTPQRLWHNPDPPPGWGTILAYAVWITAPFEMRLSVYGGVRPTSRSAASLSISWRDELRAAEPFLAEVEAREAILQRVQDTIVPTFVTLTTAQTPIVFEPYGDPRARPSSAPRLLQRALRALRSENLCDTPPPLRELLGTNDVALWQVPESDTWAVSTHWDSVILASHGAELTLTPHRGLGQLVLQVDDLRLVEAFGSQALEDFARRIAEAARRQFQLVELWDR